MRALDWRRRPAAMAAAAAITALGLGVLAGCRYDPDTSVQPSSPPLQRAAADAPAREFYPLSLGNTWEYDRVYTIEIEVISGPPYNRIETFEAVTMRRIVGSEDIDGTEYVVEQTTLIPTDRPDTLTRWTRFRQDHAGLYAADVSSLEPPGYLPRRAHHGAWPPRPRERLPRIAGKAWGEHARKLDRLDRLLAPGIGSAPVSMGRPGGALPGETVQLAYPLHEKRTWFNREEPFFVRSEVEAQEVLDVPAGRFPSYRVRVDNEFLDPNDRVLGWYGRCGRLALSVHTETLALDVETGEMARITTDEVEQLRGLSIFDTMGCGRGR